MISHEEYAQAIQNLETKEKQRQEAISNGNIFKKLYEDSLELAKKENKLVFILFHMSGCDGCKVMQYMLDNDEVVRKALEPYVVLTYDVHTTISGLTSKYNVYSYPTCVIVDANQKVIKQKSGCPITGGPQNQFVLWLN